MILISFIGTISLNFMKSRVLVAMPLLNVVPTSHFQTNVNHSMADWTGNINSNINNKTNNSSSSMHEDANSTAAVNACRLMDSIMTTPTWNHSIFTDSVQLFSTDLLREAEEPQQKRYHQTISGTKTLETIFSEIQEALYAAQQRLESKLGEVPYNANYISSSISLKLDQNMKASFDRATTELIRSMQKFEELYEQELSQSITAYHHRHHLCNESGDVTQLSSKQQQQETVPAYILSSRFG
ncbi:hypothetical protein BCR41DRAFT_176436 [Lobosporangium transversale]|uniref:Uncharacterized protein n=1 Tax=Lobosporangium transversale TaxID=64571 RepID=A0A1Y2GAQ5_9FUNG|nr:hypothetical protein BCR41DRAFT_176436 [Lobosporangium transversale]ORZ05721.1 hypothetical protein BCR41DRAFT_176436 [Lobosporangium transversale]|eukprot:XP_021877208.1 hypothetical protein BCR41DRAFT_176436 [Lobosporangium transversale]